MQLLSLEKEEISQDATGTSSTDSLLRHIQVFMYRATSLACVILIFETSIHSRVGTLTLKIEGPDSKIDRQPDHFICQHD
jgi:hypothetical protein